MGRHKLYHSPEEKAVANRTKSKRYDERYGVIYPLGVLFVLNDICLKGAKVVSTGNTVQNMPEQ
jgi:hypothetical protein